jgi:hypothetical protein
MYTLATIEQWHHGLRIFHRAHSRAAVLYERRSIVLGLPTIALTAITGTTVFSTMNSTTGTWVKVVTGVMSLSASVLAALQTFLRYPELAERHRAASQSYGALRREVEEILATRQEGSPFAVPADLLKSLRERWNAVDNIAPNIPQRLYDAVEASLKTSRGDR